VKIAIMGGDLRNLYLQVMLEKDGHNTYLYGFSKLNLGISSLYKALAAPIIIGGIPFAKGTELFAPYNERVEIDKIIQNIGNDKLLIGGNLGCLDLKCNFIDLLCYEQFLVKNAIPTSEGVVSLAINYTKNTIKDSSVIIIGYGRIGSICANLFAALGARVAVVVLEQKETLKTNFKGEVILYRDINEYLLNFDIIINTPSQDVINHSNLQYIKKDALIIDVSSQPFGVNEEIEKDIKILRPRGLPAKVAPKSAALYIKEVISSYLE